ncbi:MAG: hypothetical protein IPH62_02500 [Ignavibacteriae bacterium]|nr:hypothetical protein [Ignavibacteriota bacterium]
MYLVELDKTSKDLSKFNNSQLVCSYFFLRKTYNYLYRENLRKLDKKEKRAIIYDISLFQNLKNKISYVRNCSPQKWLEDSEVYNNLVNEIVRRKLPLNQLDVC